MMTQISFTLNDFWLHQVTPQYGKFKSSLLYLSPTGQRQKVSTGSLGFDRWCTRECCCYTIFIQDCIEIDHLFLCFYTSYCPTPTKSVIMREQLAECNLPQLASSLLCNHAESICKQGLHRITYLLGDQSGSLRVYYCQGHKIADQCIRFLIYQQLWYFSLAGFGS